MSEAFSFAGRHATNKRVQDVIFRANAAAEQAVAVHGRDRVVNATVGAILDEDERLAMLPTVLETLKSLPNEEFSAYSPFLGTPGFRASVKRLLFGDHPPEGYLEVAATAGSTGALRNAFWNYLDVGDAVLVPDWYWAPYQTIAAEHLRRVETFALFEADGSLGLSALAAALEKLYATQQRVVLVINDPCHNPTGFELSLEQWEGLMGVLRAAVADGDRRLVLVVDAPYLEYGTRGPAARDVLRALAGTPRNLLATVAFSISKSLTLYGLRVGAWVALSREKAAVEEFLELNGASARGVWTNVPRAGMSLVSRLEGDAGLMSRVEAEREGLRAMLQSRARVFLAESAEAGLPLMPYRAGFFASIPSRNPGAVVELLMEKQVFAVPLKLGVRLALSGIPARKIPGLATILAGCVRQVDG